MLAVAALLLLCHCSGVSAQTGGAECEINGQIFDFCLFNDIPDIDIYWTITGNETLSVTFSGQDRRWAAMGFSSNTGDDVEAMAGSNAVIGCGTHSTDVTDVMTVDFFMETRLTVGVRPTGNQGLLSYNEMRLNGRCIVSFERPLAPPDVEPTQHINDRLQRVVIAAGMNEGLAYHDLLRAFFDVNFVQGVATEAVTGVAITPVRVAHGALMAIAFGLCFPLGILSAHHKQRIYSGAEAGGLKLWFQVHRALMPLGALLSTVSWIMILINEREFFGAPLHLGLGTGAMALIFIQLSFVNFRPKGGKPVSPERRRWNLAHWWNGRIAWILAFVNTVIGFFVLDGPIGYFVAFLVVTGIILIIYITLDIMEAVQGSGKGKSDRMATSDVAMDDVVR